MATAEEKIIDKMKFPIGIPYLTNGFDWEFRN
jgi:hypothetical protein